MNQPQYIGVLSTAPSPHRPWLGAVKLKMLKPLLGLLFIFAAAAMSLQSCPTLCNPIDGRPPGSPVPGILQARTLEWVAISFTALGLNCGTWGL